MYHCIKENMENHVVNIIGIDIKIYRFGGLFVLYMPG